MDHDAHRLASPTRLRENSEAGETTPARLSKTSIAGFEQCAKKLWLKIYQPKAARFDPATLRLFESGHRVGELAREAFPTGTLVSEDHHQLLAAVVRTRELTDLPDPRPIFEGAFLYANVAVRADILVPADMGAWSIIEVKNSRRVRPAFISDLASQCWVLQGCGVKLAGIYLRHPVEPLRPWRDARQISFVDADVGNDVRSSIAGKAEIVRSASMVAAGAVPDVPTGPHCFAPYRCEFRNFCGSSKPETLNLRT